MPMQCQKRFRIIVFKTLNYSTMQCARSFQLLRSRKVPKSKNSPLKPSGQLKLLELLEPRGSWGPCRIYSALELASSLMQQETILRALWCF